MKDFHKLLKRSKYPLPSLPECSHRTTEIRRRVQTNGAISAARQCVGCGRQAGTAVRLADLPGGKRPEHLPAWDAAAEDAYMQSVRNYYAQAKDAQNEWWFKIYDEYLESPEWKKKRERVMERVNHKCEGCLLQPAQQVHHLTYENVGREMLFELVALCADCHSIIHDKAEDAK